MAFNFDLPPEDMNLGEKEEPLIKNTIGQSFTEGKGGIGPTTLKLFFTIVVPIYPFIRPFIKSAERAEKKNREFEKSLPDLAGVTLNNQKELGLLNRKLRKCERKMDNWKSAETALKTLAIASTFFWGPLGGLIVWSFGQGARKMADFAESDGQKLNQENATAIQTTETLEPFKAASSFFDPALKPDITKAVAGVIPEGVGILDKKLRTCEKKMADRKATRDTLRTLAIASALSGGAGVIPGLAYYLVSAVIGYSAKPLRDEGKKLNEENAATIKEHGMSPFEEPQTFLKKGWKAGTQGLENKLNSTISAAKNMAHQTTKPRR